MQWGLLLLNTLPGVLVPAVLALIVGLTTTGRTRRLATLGLAVVAVSTLLLELFFGLRGVAALYAGSLWDILQSVLRLIWMLASVAGGFLVLLSVMRPPTRSAPTPSDPTGVNP